jgi:hypothetical protein
MRGVATLLGALLATGAQAAPADADRATMIRIAPSVVKVESFGDEGRFQLGSGVVVGRERVVTNCHVTRRAARVAVVKGGVRWPVSEQSSDVAHDLCLLHAPGIDSAPVPLVSSASLRLGQELIAIGYTGGVEMALSQGEIVGLHRWDGARIIQSTNGFSSGASGGALLTTAGELVGILTFRMRGADRSYYSAPSDWLRGRIDDASLYRPVAPLDGAAFWELAGDAQPYFLQAASLEQRQQWALLSELARRWEHDSPADAAYAQGIAQDGLGRADTAVDAWQLCVELDPSYVPAWQRLVRLYRRMGRTLDTQRALERLRSLDTQIARALAAELDLR